MPETYILSRGYTPLLISLPHGGTFIPAKIGDQMTSEARQTPDTDWHVNLLYDFVRDLGASLIAATHSRYVIDLNRDPTGIPLYKDSDNTELLPLKTFEHLPIYTKGNEPTGEDKQNRVREFWHPYHTALNQELSLIKDRHGYAILFDGHSIKSNVPRFFKGKLPDLNLGTGNGLTADTALINSAFSILENSSYSAVLDERFTGGYITRSLGNPKDNIHAIQLELTWANYMMESPPYRFLDQKAKKLQAVLKYLIETIIQCKPYP